MTQSPQAEGSGTAEEGELLRLTDLRFRNFWLIPAGAALLLAIARLTGPSPFLFISCLPWAGLSATLTIQWMQKSKYDIWTNESGFIVRSGGTAWTYPVSAAAISDGKLAWVMDSERSSGRIVINIFSCHEGVLSDKVGKRLLKAGLDFGIPGWSMIQDPVQNTKWTSSPLETGSRFALVGCFVPALGFLFSGIAFAGTTGPWIISVMAFWAGWTALAALLEEQLTGQKWRFECADLVTQKEREAEVKHGFGDVRCLKIVEGNVGWHRGKQVILVTHYGREVPLTGLEGSWSGSSSALLNEARSRGYHVTIEARGG